MLQGSDSGSTTIIVMSGLPYDLHDLREWLRRSCQGLVYVIHLLPHPRPLSISHIAFPYWFRWLASSWCCYVLSIGTYRRTQCGKVHTHRTVLQRSS